MHQKARAFYVLKKTQTKALTFVRTFDKTGNIGNDHTAVRVNLVDHDAKIGRKRGKGVSRNLGPCRRNLRDKGGLARIGQTQQACIGQNFQLKAQIFFLTGFTGLAKTRGTHGRRLEMFVALAAATATGHQHFCIGIAEVSQQLLAIGAFGKNQRAHRQVQHHVFTLLAIALTALAGAAITGLVQTLEAKIVQRQQTTVGLQKNRTTVAAVATVWPAARHELFAPERKATMPALTGAHLNSCFIYKSHGVSLRSVRAVRQPCCCTDMYMGLPFQTCRKP